MLLVIALKMQKLQKRIRLKEFNYLGTYRYFVTICCERKTELFKNSKIVEICVRILEETAKKEQFRIWAYCFMPDHLHMLAEGANDKSNFRRFISVLKQKTGYILWTQMKTKLWQENYYEHILRKEEDTLTVVKYILNNPVRKGILRRYNEYPYSGSFELDIRYI